MKIKIESNGVSLKVATKDETKDVDFKTVVKAYELVTGDVLEITEEESEKPAQRQSKSIQNNGSSYLERPQYREPVKTDVACPYCGFIGAKNVPFGYRFMNCPQCKEKIFLQKAADTFGEKDEHGFYYKASEMWRDDEDKRADDDLLNRMKVQMEAHEPLEE